MLNSAELARSISAQFSPRRDFRYLIVTIGFVAKKAPCANVTPLECALTQKVEITPLECALTKKKGVPTAADRPLHL